MSAPRRLSRRRLLRRAKMLTIGLEVLRAEAREVPTASSPSVREAGEARAGAASAARPISAERSEAASRISRIPTIGLEVLRAEAREVPTASPPSVREAGEARAGAASAARPISAERSEAFLSLLCLLWIKSQRAHLKIRLRCVIVLICQILLIFRQVVSFRQH